MSDQILIVDDDANLLQGLRRQLRKKYNLTFANGGVEARDLIDAGEEFAVVISDMQMPDLNGLELLCYVREKSENTTRIMLTGNADLKTATDAVNEGAVFRYLNKPCKTDELELAITEGIDQHKLVTVEKQVLEQTLNGSIELMTDVLSLLNPAAFGRANQIRRIAKTLGKQTNIHCAWQVEAATVFAQVGRATIPEDVLRKYYSNESLTADEQQMIDNHPVIAAKLVGRIPRMESVSEIVARQTEIGKTKADSNDPIQQCAELLDLVLTYDELAHAFSVTEAINQLRANQRFNQHADWIELLNKAVCENFEISSVSLAELENGMILDEDILDSRNVLVVTKGQEVSDSLLAKLQNFGKSDRTIAEPIRVRRNQPALIGSK